MNGPLTADILWGLCLLLGVHGFTKLSLSPYILMDAPDRFTWWGPFEMNSSFVYFGRAPTVCCKSWMSMNVDLDV